MMNDVDFTSVPEPSNPEPSRIRQLWLLLVEWWRSVQPQVQAAVRLVAYTRFSWLSALLLLLLAFLPSRWLLPIPTVQAVFIQEQQWRLLHVSWFSFFAAAFISMTMRTTYANAGERFGEPLIEIWWQRTKDWKFNVRDLGTWGLGLPVPLASLYYSATESNRLLADLLAEFVGGIATGLIGILLIEKLHQWVLTPNLFGQQDALFDVRFGVTQGSLRERSSKSDGEEEAKEHAMSPWSKWIHERLARAFAVLGPGYTESKQVYVRRRVGETSEVNEETMTALRFGHGSLLFFVLVLLIFYFVVYHLSFAVGRFPDDTSHLGTLFYVIGLIVVFAGVATGVAFCFDRLRIPASVMLIALYLLLNSLFAPENHFYTITPALPPDAIETPYQTLNQIEVANQQDPGRSEYEYLDGPVRLEDVVEGWRLRQSRIDSDDPNRTFVIVTAAGGGIQASAWTTKVLTEMHRQYGPRFTGSIGLISSVSGGSVGTLLYLPHYERLTSLASDTATIEESLATVHDQSCRSSLEAVGWGLLFPDALRMIGGVNDPLIDRGWVQEQVWASRMDANSGTTATSIRDWRLGHLAAKVRRGQLPAVVFNSYAIDTGQRVWIAPLVLDHDGSRRRDSKDFLEMSVCGTMRMRLATAARLSATFPYVSPTAIASQFGPPRNDPMDNGNPKDDLSWTTTASILQNVHLADGGYTDNEGLLTALTLAQELQKRYRNMQKRQRPFDKILLVRIAPFPIDPRRTEATLSELLDQGHLEVPDVSSSLTQNVVGPMIGMYKGRQSSQVERGRETMQLWELLAKAQQDVFQASQSLTSLTLQSSDLEKSLQGAVLQINEIEQKLVASLTSTGWSVDPDQMMKKLPAATEPIGFESILIDFQNGGAPPLSWRLTQSEQQALDLAWANWQLRHLGNDLGFDLQPAEPVAIAVEATPDAPAANAEPDEATSARADMFSEQRLKLDNVFKPMFVREKTKPESAEAK